MYELNVLFTQSNRFEYLSSKVQLYKNGKNATQTCDICFKTMRGDHLKRHMMTHMNGRKEEKEEQKDDEVQTEVEQNYEIIRKNKEF